MNFPLAAATALPTLDLAQVRVMAERERAKVIRGAWMAASEPFRRRIGPVAWRISNALRAAIAEHGTTRELRGLDQHLLSDIGLERADIRGTSRDLARRRFSGHWRPIRPLVDGMSVCPTPVTAANDAAAAATAKNAA